MVTTASLTRSLGCFGLGASVCGFTIVQLVNTTANGVQPTQLQGKHSPSPDECLPHTRFGLGLPEIPGQPLVLLLSHCGLEVCWFYT